MSESIHVILHILADLNGRIDGPFFADPHATAALGAYGRLRSELKCDAALYGQTTMAEGFCDGMYPHAHAECLNHFEDHVADDHAQNYLVSLDPLGTLDFDSGSVSKKGRPAAHVIQVLSGKVSRAYLDHLRARGVSWIFGGSDELDLQDVLEKLESKWHIKRLMIAGGGKCDWSFARKNLIDELSIVVAPLASAENGTPSIFEAMRDDDLTCTAYQLVKALPLEGDALWLNYKKK